MAFVAGNRVKCVDNHSDYRGKLATVMSVNGDGSYNVRFDGFPSSQLVLLLANQVIGTTLPDPINYADE